MTPAEKRAAELEVLNSLSDADLIHQMERELDTENEENEAERKFMLRFMNLARKGAGLPEVAVQ